MGDAFVFQQAYQDKVTIYKSNGAFYYVNQVCQEPVLTLEQSFALGGTYIFAEINHTLLEGFYQNLLGYMKRAGEELSFLWITNPAQELWNWSCYWIACSSKQSKVWRLGGYSEMKFDAYRLIFHGECQIQCQKDTLLFTLDSVAREQSIATAPAMVRMNNQMCQISDRGITLSFEEATAGTLEFELEVMTDGVADVFEQMNACIKYCAPLGETVIAPWRQGNLGIISSPVLFCTSNLKLQGQIHPNDLQNHDLTYFLLYRATEASNLFDSSFVDIGGQQKKLLLGNDARMVFEKIPRYIYYDTKNKIYAGAQTYYLGFAGSYYLQNAEKHLLCGLSGTEFLDITKAASLEVCFHSNQNSFFGDQGQQDLCTTSWVSFPQNSWYYSQPEIAPMYSANDEGVLRFLEIPTTMWNVETPAVPLAFYNHSRVSFMNSKDVENIESYIYKKRYELITGRVLLTESTLPCTEAQPLTTVTPQGLMAGVSPDTGAYAWFAIAQTDATQELPTLRFSNISEDLRMKLQNSKLFINIEDKAKFLQNAQPVGDFKIMMDGWCFLLSPEDWKIDAGQHNTAFVMKYVKGVAIKELMKESLIFQGSMSAAYDDKKQVLPRYRRFIDCVEDPDFQGILYLNCMVSIAELPREIEFLLKGVKQENFYAHHVILENNKVVQDDQGVLTMENASIQALVDYRNGESIVYEEAMPDYLFTTTRMTVGFLNSSLQNFSSVSEILMNRFYGAKSSKTDTTSGNCMIIDGMSQRKDGLEEYVFSLREACNYQLSNSAMESVQIDSAQLSVGSEAGCIGRVTFAGGIQTNNMTECDMLSYDWLAFQCLQLVVPEVGELYFDYESLVLSESSSSLREHSFGARFACQLEQVIYETKKMPSDQGYASISSPLKQNKLQQPWAGLVWKVNLGSLGDLSNSGELVIRILICWSIGEQGPEYYLGVALPGIMDGFDLEGIVKLGFQSVELMVVKNETVQYMLRLHNYTLRLLWLAIPPGSNDLFIFADGKKLGWYAAYLGEES